MWQPLSKLFDLIGKIRISYGPSRVDLTVGNPNERDAMDSTYWREYLDTRKLFDIWGPVPVSEWEPYHCVPLFAAIASLPKDRIGPTHPDMVREIEGNGHLTNELMRQPLGKTWADQKSWVILDIPGATSVPVAVRMIAAGFQPVCTFDHWPHREGILKPEIILAQLLRYAAFMSDFRKYLTVNSPPLWVCDRGRLGNRAGKVREFDNRYYLDDSILPSADTLRRNGIQQIICMVPSAEDKPTLDLRAYFRDLRKENFGNIYGVALRDPNVELFRFPEDTFQVSFKQSGFRRSDAGGFGMLIPEPSSSGG